MLARYKRFLADVQLSDGSRITMHCANTGAMLNCLYPGLPVYFSTHANPKRKYPHSLELVTDPEGNLICVNTAMANKVVGELLEAQQLSVFSNETFRSEVKIPDESGRFDFGNDRSFVEVKSVTYLKDGWGAFPDAQSERATKHVQALRRRVADGDRAVLLLAAMHTGINQVTIAGEIDPVYLEAVIKALEEGVEVFALRFNVKPHGIEFDSLIPFEVNPQMNA